MAHIGAVGGSIFACQGPGVQRKFKLPKEYKQYLKSPESHDECADKNDDDDTSQFTMTDYPLGPNGALWSGVSSSSGSDESDNESGNDGGNDSGNTTPINNNEATKRVGVQREPIQTRNKGDRNKTTTTGKQQQQRRKQIPRKAKKKRL
jgi:hypothetical protein